MIVIIVRSSLWQRLRLLEFLEGCWRCFGDIVVLFGYEGAALLHQCVAQVCMPAVESLCRRVAPHICPSQATGSISIFVRRKLRVATVEPLCRQVAPHMPFTGIKIFLSRLAIPSLSAPHICPSQATGSISIFVRRKLRVATVVPLYQQVAPHMPFSGNGRFLSRLAIASLSAHLESDAIILYRFMGTRLAHWAMAWPSVDGGQ